MHFHDLRHTGNMLAADAGANLRELMDRMGHSTTHAATVYLHASDERQQAVATSRAGWPQSSWTAPRGRHRARNGHANAGRHHGNLPDHRQDIA
jgi:hypothetical protein